MNFLKNTHYSTGALNHNGPNPAIIALVVAKKRHIDIENRQYVGTRVVHGDYAINSSVSS
jgi:hypothetical protein